MCMVTVALPITLPFGIVVFSQDSYLYLHLYSIYKAVETNRLKSLGEEND